MNSLLSWIDKRLATLGSDWGLLVLRLWVGQEFLYAGWNKLAGGLTPPEWFVGLDFPFPHNYLSVNLNWLAAGGSELIFSVTLMLGLMTRFSALALLYMTYVAVYTVHFDLGWAGWNQIETDTGLGFKIPLMIACMLLALITQGGGKLGADAYVLNKTPA